MRPHLIFLFVLAACAPFPDLDDTLDETARSAAFPDLVPLAPILAAVDGDRIQRQPLTAEARVSDLRARAARLSGPVIEPALRRRMGRAITLQQAGR